MQNILEEIKKEAKNIGFDQNSTNELGSLIATLCASKRAGSFLELGTGCGLSTYWFIQGMDEESSLVSVDNQKELIDIAKKYIKDSRVTFKKADAKDIILSSKKESFDIIFADTWEGKYSYLDETIALLKVGGFYIIDDMLPQSNWPDGHEKKVEALREILEQREDLVISFLDCTSGVYICTKVAKQSNSWNPKLYKKSASFVSDMALDLIDILDPKENEHILDLGCGEGSLALEIKKRGARVVGIDLSANMVEAAKAKGVDARVMSATNLAFSNEFDAIFSNAVLHWVLEPKKAIKNIKKALKQNGRFVAEFGGAGNVASIVEAIRAVFAKHKEFGEFINPWYFPSASEYKKLLEEEGFRVEFIKIIPRPTPIDDISNWLDIFTNGVTSKLNSKQKEQFKSEVKKLLEPKLYSIKEGWVADYVRLRVKAIKI